MENASKALLMAGGVLLTMLVVMLFIFGWNVISNYYQMQDDLSKIDNVKDFNLQFTNYDRDDVHGYELVSLANKVADYNNKFGTTDADSDYVPVTLKFYLVNETTGQDESVKLSYYSDKNLLFTQRNNAYIQSDRNNLISTILTKVNSIVRIYGDENATTKIAKSIDSIRLTDEQLEYNKNNKGMTYEESYINAIYIYNSLTNGEKIQITGSAENAYKQMINMLESNGNNIMQYYEYYQFKRAIFKCTDIGYDNKTGKVNSITFYFTGKIE